MTQILVLNENRMERENTRSILSEGLPGSEIFLAASLEQAIELLQDGSMDLLIVDVPQFDLDHCTMLTEVKRIAQDTPILVTSVGKRMDIAAHVWRLGVQDFLLKPCRPAWLLAAVNALRRGGSRAADSREEQRREKYLKRIAEHMQAFLYKKCTEDAKEYLDSLYKEKDNMNVVRSNAVSFAEGLAQMGESLGATAQLKLAGSLEQFRLRFDLQGRKYDTFLVYEKMLDIIFAAFDENRSYQVSDEQRVLNYIDRSIKDGISLDEAAEYANMSSCYFSKFFKKVMGMNFITYVTDCKIEAAQRMLEDTDMSVINIAYELSYSETNYFSKAFKKKVGVTPTEYRGLHLNGQKLVIPASEWALAQGSSLPEEAFN